MIVHATLTALTWNGHTPGEVSRYGLKGKASVSGGHNGVASRNRDDGRVLTDRDSGRVQRTGDGKVNFSDAWDLTTKNMMLMLGSLLDSSAPDEV